MTIFIGVDPGLDGALAAIDGRDVVIHNTPTLEIREKKKVRRSYAIKAMCDILDLYQQGEVQAVLEQASAMPGQNVVATMKQGYGIGIWEALLVAYDIPYTLVWPATWKRDMLGGMSKDGKGASIVRAAQLFPGVAFPRKGDHNRAEALLLADWLRRQQGPPVRDPQVIPLRPVRTRVP